MANKLTRVSFGARNYVSGQQVRFYVYDKNGNELYNLLGQELGNTGIYFVEGNLNFTNKGDEIYTIIAEEINGNWKAHKTITQNSEFIIDK